MNLDVIFSLIHQIPIYDQTELILYVVASLFAALLIGLSVSSYIKTGLINLRYAILVFFLFCAFLIYENLEHIFSLDNPSIDIIIPVTGLTVMVFFFLSVNKRV
jgi:hypothetical protein